MTTFFKVNIKAIQDSKGLTRKEMAKVLGIGVHLYDAWMDGRSKATHEALAIISGVFDITIDDLIKRPLKFNCQIS